MNIFDGKKKNAISASGFPDKYRPFIFWLFCCRSISEAVFKKILNNLYVFKAATFVE